MDRDIKFIRKRIEYLEVTARDLKETYENLKIPILEDYYLEIECYCHEIKQRLIKICKEVKKCKKK